MTVIAQPRGPLEYRHGGVLSRVRALLLAGVLDRALAGGVPPEASVLLAVQAQRIVRPQACRAQAATLRRLVAGPHPRSTVPVSRVRVQSAAARLDAISARLETDGPIAARGVAALRVLISDGAGPLYRASTDLADLADRLTHILADLEPV